MSKPDDGMLRRGDRVCYLVDWDKALVGEATVKSITYRPENDPAQILPELDWNKLMGTDFDTAARFELRTDSGEIIPGPTAFPKELSAEPLGSLHDVNQEETQSHAAELSEDPEHG